jgi:hypothetical protein
LIIILGSSKRFVDVGEWNPHPLLLDVPHIFREYPILLVSDQSHYQVIPALARLLKVKKTVKRGGFERDPLCRFFHGDSMCAIAGITFHICHFLTLLYRVI